MKLKAGTWEPDLAVSEASLAQAQTAVAQAQVSVDQLTVYAPRDGEALQVNLRAGEYVSATSDNLIVFGDTSTLHIRVDIDEVDIPRFQGSGKAIATRRGDTQHQYALSLVRIEPLVIPKVDLTGQSQERTDTRVLQVIFRVDSVPAQEPLYVGQQVDVFALHDSQTSTNVPSKSPISSAASQ